jgi:hypothetical protein
MVQELTVTVIQKAELAAGRAQARELLLLAGGLVPGTPWAPGDRSETRARGSTL